MRILIPVCARLRCPSCACFNAAPAAACDAIRASAAAIFDASVCEHVNAAYRTAQSLLRRLTIILRAFSAFSRGGFHAEILVGNLVMQLLSDEPREDFERSTSTRSRIRETRQCSRANALAPDTFGHYFLGFAFTARADHNLVCGNQSTYPLPPSFPRGSFCVASRMACGLQPTSD